MDADIAVELTENLFQQDNEKFGLDLVSLNIQRGRDHGLAPYTSWRNLCGLPAIKSWKELATVFPQTIVPRLQVEHITRSHLTLHDRQSTKVWMMWIYSLVASWRRERR